MKLFSLPLFWTYLIIYNKYLKDKSYQKISLLKFSTIALLTSFFTSIVNFLMLLYLDITLLDQKKYFFTINNINFKHNSHCIYNSFSTGLYIAYFYFNKLY